MTRVTALMYHDIVSPGCDDASGFPGRDAALYKLTHDQFDAHLRALAKIPGANSTALTFDDGGVSAMAAADALEEHGWRGYFFVTVDYIGAAGFVDETDLRDLNRRGHIVGSHSCSHPLRMAHCSPQQLADEWTRSRRVLSTIIGTDVRCASVPGGDFGRNVARAAAEAGFTQLFTSEPTRHIRQHGPLTIRGRFTIQRWTTAETAAALALGSPAACARQSIVWTAKKLSKRLGGSGYLRLRRALLRHGDEVRWGDQEQGSGVRE